MLIREEDNIKMKEFFSYRNGITLEHKIEQAWYGNEKNPSPIMHWNPEATELEFQRLCSHHFKSCSCMVHDWLERVVGAEELIRTHIAEALLSKSPYVRAYANILIRGHNG